MGRTYNFGLTPPATTSNRRALAAKPVVGLYRSSPPSNLESSVLLLAVVFLRCFPGVKASSHAYTRPSVFSIPRGGSEATEKTTEEATTVEATPSPPQTFNTAPLWSGGVYQDDIDDLVNACLSDPDINIASIPDWLERQIYRSTITLVLNALHRALNGIHGKKLWKHEFQLTRLPRRKNRISKAIESMSQQISSDSHNQVLERVADRLLANKAINQPLIPDVLERQLYANCLKIVFRVLDLLAVSFRLTLCGHDLGLKLDPVVSREGYEEEALERLASSNTTSCLTDLTVEQMLEVAREMGAASHDQRPFWLRWLSPANNDFIAQIHASVYCLILGILDDLLEHTEIQLLSDRIEFDLVPVSPTSVAISAIDGANEQGVLPPPRPSRSPQTRAVLVLGVALGYALHAVLAIHGDKLAKHGTDLLESIPSMAETFVGDAPKKVRSSASAVKTKLSNIVQGLSDALRNTTKTSE